MFKSTQLACAAGLCLGLLNSGFVSAQESSNSFCVLYSSIDSRELAQKESILKEKQEERNVAVKEAQVKSLDWLRQKTPHSKAIAIKQLYLAEKIVYQMLFLQSNLQEAKFAYNHCQLKNLEF